MSALASRSRKLAFPRVGVRRLGEGKNFPIETEQRIVDRNDILLQTVTGVTDLKRKV